MDSGKSSKEVVERLIRNLNAYCEYMSDKMDGITKATEDLGNWWKDAQYAQVESLMTDLCNQMRKDIQVLRDASDGLQEKVNMY